MSGTVFISLLSGKLLLNTYQNRYCTSQFQKNLGLPLISALTTMEFNSLFLIRAVSSLRRTLVWTNLKHYRDRDDISLSGCPVSYPGIELANSLMEYTTTQALSATGEDWKMDREEALNCHSFDLQPLINRVLDRWKSASIGYQAMANAQLDRARSLSLARSLRLAEQAIGAVVSAAFPAIQEGYYVERMDDLMFALLKCRMLIVLPTAKRMAERDDMGRSEEAIAFLLARKAQFIDGRAVIDQALASEMPSPYKTDDANT